MTLAILWRSKQAESDFWVRAMPSASVLTKPISSGDVVRDALERPAQIVVDLEEFAREARDGVFAGLVDLARRAAPQVLDLGHRAQHLVLGIGELGLERRHMILGRRRRLGCVGRGFGRIVAVARLVLRAGRILAFGMLHRFDLSPQLPSRRDTTRAV